MPRPNACLLRSATAAPYINPSSRHSSLRASAWWLIASACNGWFSPASKANEHEHHWKSICERTRHAIHDADQGQPRLRGRHSAKQEPRRRDGPTCRGIGQDRRAAKLGRNETELGRYANPLFGRTSQRGRRPIRGNQGTHRRVRDRTSCVEAGSHRARRARRHDPRGMRRIGIRNGSPAVVRSRRMRRTGGVIVAKIRRKSTMRFMMLMIPKGYENAAPGAMPDAAAVAAMMAYNEELQKAGVLVTLDGLHPPSMGARVSFSNGKPSVIDGPFAEAKEVLGGYWMIDVKSKQEAIEWEVRCPASNNEV